jgi:hypothetical protein
MDDSDTDENDSIIDEIYYQEEQFLEARPSDKEYVIGMYQNIRNSLLYTIGISVPTFFQRPFDDIIRYMRTYSITRISHPTVHILQVVYKTHYFVNSVWFFSMEVLVKTYWLRLIQRHWRSAFRAYRTRQKLCVLSGKWELTGGKRKGGKVGLRGLLRDYVK